MLNIHRKLQMKLSSSIHECLTDRAICLLKQFGVTTVVQLLSMKPEKLCSILSLSYSMITKVRMEIFREHSAFPEVGLDVYQASLEDEVQLHSGSIQLDKLVGKLQGGTVYEVFGHSSSGKTQICLTVAAVCARVGGRVIYADSKGDFDPARLAQICCRRGGDLADMDRIIKVKVDTYKSLLLAVTKVVDELENIKLVVVDNVTFPIMSMMGNKSTVRTAFATSCKVGHQLHQLASMHGAVVMVVSNMRGGDQCNSPALGGIWDRLADVRMLMEQVTEEERMVTVMRGRGLGGKCKVVINDSGVCDSEK